MEEVSPYVVLLVVSPYVVAKHGYPASILSHKTLK